ncbi:GNAT family acetyltransferase YiiD [Vibrio variabilis]|uniref:GNAT family acetyltransferase YiiD n=2 Tax=Vibrionaceae TaxID=641 RepID=A0ABQ0JC70_9VIBR|nr:GNAT family acetyltransferase YiiD [Vibrio variabilis]
MTWLLMRERGLVADIVLADSRIRYKHPVESSPVSVTSLDGISGDLDRLAAGKKARIVINVTIYSGDSPAVEFVGTYMLLPNYQDKLLSS